MALAWIINSELHIVLSLMNLEIGIRVFSIIETKTIHRTFMNAKTRMLSNSEKWYEIVHKNHFGCSNFVQNSTFLSKLKFVSKIKMFVENQNFCQKSDFFFKNWTFCQKSKFLSKINFFVRNQIFCQKSKFSHYFTDNSAINLSRSSAPNFSLYKFR